MLLWKDGSMFDSFSKNSSDDEPQPSSNAEKKDDEGVSKASGFSDQEQSESSTPNINIVGPSINTASANFKTGRSATLEATHADLFVDETEIDIGLFTKLITGIEEEVYVTQPPGFKDPDHPDKVYKVVKALYGLHQAPRAWYETLANYLLGNGFKRGKIDQTLFIKKQKGDILLVQVYVDDIIFGSTNKELCTAFEKLMKDKFQMSSMGELTFFLGLQVQQKEDGIFISQDKYVAEILKKFNYTDVKSASTPVDLEKPLVKDGDADDVDVHLYRSMIGSLMYLTASRPDIMFAVCACARFQVTPKTSHLLAVKRIFRYLKGKPTLGLWYSRDSPFELVAYTDSDYAGATQDRKSTTGGCQFLGNRLISWQCKKQTVVATSTTEAEYVAAASCCRQILWIQNQLLDYGYNFMNTVINIDNNSTICIIENPVQHSKTKHIEIRHHFIRDCNAKKLIQMVKIHTDHNVADLLTKGFDAGRHVKRGWDTKIPQSSGPPVKVGDEAVHKEVGDKMKRAATTTSSLEAEQDIGSGPRGYTLGSGEDSMKLLELIELCTKLSDLVSKKEKRDMEIIDFLNANQIHYALTVNPTIYTSCIEQFWATEKAKTVNGERQLQALVDKKKVIITETSIRSHLHLEDAGGIDCLSTATIFEELARMGYEKPSQKLTFYKAFFSPQWKFLIHTITQCLSAKTIAWNKFSSTMASAIICLATNQKFNLSKCIFDAMVKYLEGGVKFLMYLRFIQVFINQQLGDMSHHKKIDSTADILNEEHVPTHSNDPLLNGEDRMKLTELMNMCTKLSERVLDLEHTKTAQAQEITNLKLRVKKLEKKAGFKTHNYKRLYKGRSKIKAIGKDAEVTLVKTQRRNDDNLMFDTGVFDGDEIVVETEEPSAKPKEKDMVQESSENVSTATTTVVAISAITTPP
ncbi:putative ribonuclease H-like domain-containing protein [Tanacetum coccineum]|uniref:Ribonuclease H-like domain-containing protein n=1 Tax=Tanacetum coccineum TaxID=301880 RepID=A0ABQ5FPD1_9ASTR